MDREGGMAGRVAESGNRDDAGCDLGAGLERPHLLSDVLEDAPRVEEIAMHRAGRPAHIVVVHPEFPFRLRHQDFGIGENLVAVLGLDASIWSGWKCEMRMMSIAPGLMPAAARLAFMKPAVSVI